MEPIKPEKSINDIAEQFIKADRELKDAIINDAAWEEIKEKRTKFMELAMTLNRNTDNSANNQNPAEHPSRNHY